MCLLFSLMDAEARGGIYIPNITCGEAFVKWETPVDLVTSMRSLDGVCRSLALRC